MLGVMELPLPLSWNLKFFEGLGALAQTDWKNIQSINNNLKTEP